MLDLNNRAKTALWNRFVSTSGHDINDKGYLTSPEHNTLPGVSVEDFKTDLKKGSGNELLTKFLAVHSSSALAVNTFVPFKCPDNSSQLTLAGVRGLSAPVFEKQLRTGLGGTPPNLDVFVESNTTVIGVESKCLEYLTPKTAKFVNSYDQRDKLSVEDSWWDLLQELKNDPANSSHLDVAQLIKHYLGLRKLYAGKRRIILMYLFWEPENWHEFNEFKKHRRAIDPFSRRIADSEVHFVAQSYPSLWAEWDDEGVLPDHVAHLKERYWVTI